MPELPEPIGGRIRAIAADHSSGALKLTRRAAEVLLEVAHDPALLAEAAAQVAWAQPAMASMRALAETARSGSAIRAFLAELDSATEQVARIAADLIRDGMTVMTHSSSHTVLDAFLLAHRSGKRFRVIATESRPLCEGVALARTLAEAGIPVTLIVDAAAARFLPEVQLVLVGADAVSRQGVVNKIGTAALALAARERGIPMYALASSEKLLPEDVSLPDEGSKAPLEVLDSPAPGVTVANYYFDRTPLDWLEGIVTERGIRGRT